MKIIGFGHRKRTGKDEAARIIVEHFKDLKVQRFSFANELYRVCHQLYYWDGMKDKEYYEQFPEEKEKVLPKIGKTPRQIWIDFGTKAVREQVYKDTWVMAELYKTGKSDCDLAVFTDVRFPNELQAIHKFKGVVVKVERPSIPKTNDAADTPLEGIQPWDAIINNNGTLEEYKNKVITTCQKLLNI